MTRVYIACPAIMYSSGALSLARAAICRKWPDAVIFVPDPHQQVYLMHRQGIDHFVYLTLDSGEVSYGVGHELKLARARGMDVYRFDVATRSLIEQKTLPNNILSREETAAIEREYINRRNQ